MISHGRLLLIVLVLFHATSTQSALSQLANSSFASGDLTGWIHTAFTDDAYSTVLNMLLPYGASTGHALFDQARTHGVTVMDSNGVIMTQTTNFDGNGPTFTDTSISPAVGSYLAYVSNHQADAITNPNGNTLVGSYITQTFFVPTDATTLTFYARQLSNEGLDTASDIFGNTVGADFGGIALHSGSTVYGEYLFDEQSTSAANFHVTNYSNDNSIGFGGFVSGTDWQFLSFDVAALRGQTVTFTAFEVNTGDTNFESRLLLNNIVLNADPTAPSVPEPNALLFWGGLITAGGVSFLYRKRRRKGSMG